MSNLRLLRLDYDQAPPLSDYNDRNVFQTKEWLKFISLTQNAEPVIAVVLEGDRRVGRFIGLVFRKYGIRILGSPFPGWTTYYMGFNLDPSVSRVDALIALQKFAFYDLRCLHLEIMDRTINSDHFRNAGYNFNARVNSGFEIDLTKSEEELLGAMSSACRRCIRKSIDTGVRIEVANDKSFVQEYYLQLKDVFAKQGLVPPYSKERVMVLIDCLNLSEHLLLLRARNSEGICIATGIFPAMNDTMYFWGGASWRLYQQSRPNEAIQWFAMRYWKEKGIQKYNMGGGGEYKRKYGGYEIYVPWGRKSKYTVFEFIRSFAKKVFAFKQRIDGLGKR